MTLPLLKETLIPTMYLHQAISVINVFSMTRYHLIHSFAHTEVPLILENSSGPVTFKMLFICVSVRISLCFHLIYLPDT